VVISGSKQTRLLTFYNKKVKPLMYFEVIVACWELEEFA
jgi:hypothetical protein